MIADFNMTTTRFGKGDKYESGYKLFFIVRKFYFRRRCSASEKALSFRQASAHKH